MRSRSQLCYAKFFLTSNNLERDGYPSNPDDIFLTAGASAGVALLLSMFFVLLLVRFSPILLGAVLLVPLTWRCLLRLPLMPRLPPRAVPLFLLSRAVPRTTLTARGSSRGGELVPEHHLRRGAHDAQAVAPRRGRGVHEAQPTAARLGEQAWRKIRSLSC